MCDSHSTTSIVGQLDHTGQPQPGSSRDEQTSNTDPATDLPPSLNCFKFLAVKLANQQNAASGTAAAGNDSIHSQLNQYVTEVQQNLFTRTTYNPYDFWLSRQVQYEKLAPVALDILASPASQAYVERIFSVCGMLTTGRRNRMQKSLATRVCLKLNKTVLQSLNIL